MALPQHSGSNDDKQQPKKTTHSKMTFVYIALGVVVVVAFMVLHLTGVIGPESHG